MEGSLEDRVRRLFVERFGGPPASVAAAPGRVNLIGEHVDYNQGIVLPLALEMRTAVAGAPRPDHQVQVWSAQHQALGRLADVRVATPEECPTDWFRYVAGILSQCLRHGVWRGGLDLVIDSTLPMGAGLSSSAALTAAVLTLALASQGHAVDGWTAARWCQAAEHEFAGVPCGLMDPLASLLARADHLLCVDFDTEQVSWVPFAPRDVAVVTIHSGVRHELASSEYAVRRAECDAAARDLGVAHLRQATEAQWAHAAPALSDVSRRRARHVISEINRVRRAVTCCTRRDWLALGELMNQSHDSLAGDFQVSCPEVDLLVDLLRRDDRVLGARITGGGFGGCVVALMERAAWREVVEQMGAAYFAAVHLPWHAWLTDPAPGAWARRAPTFAS